MPQPERDLDGTGSSGPDVNPESKMPAPIVSQTGYSPMHVEVAFTTPIV